MAILNGRPGQAVFGTKGNDIIRVQGPSAGEGRDGADVLFGDRAANLLNGGNGNDVINAGGGNDRTLGGSGNDVIDAGPGNDLLNGGNGNDRLSAGPGNDIAVGGNGNDTVVGGPGRDLLFGNSGDDTFVIQEGPWDFSRDGTPAETVDGGAGRNTLLVNADGATVDGIAAERIFVNWISFADMPLRINYSAWVGDAPVAQAVDIQAVEVLGDGTPLAYSGSIADRHDGVKFQVTGTDGNDFFEGGRHSETVFLKGGNDVFLTSGGRDVVTFGPGSDTLVLAHAEDQDRGDDDDGWDDADPIPIRTLVRDFTPGTDSVDLSLWQGDAPDAEFIGSDTVIRDDYLEVVLADVHYDPFIA